LGFRFLASFCLFQTWIEILRGDIQHEQPDVRASIFIDADVIVDQYDQEKIYVPEKGRLV
jgi:hypothetical protein